MEQADQPRVDTQAERRKMQNRINQRAHRLRQSLKNGPNTSHKRWKLIGFLDSEDAEPAAIARKSSAAGNFRLAASSDPSPSLTMNPPQVVMSGREMACRLVPSHERERCARFETTAYRAYYCGTPQADHLLSLVKLNVYRAFVENMEALGMGGTEWMHDDAISAFCTSQPRTALDSNIPAHLQPTAIQRSIPHHPWLDFFPHPRMRDHLILLGDSFDDDELCIDIMGFWNPDKDDPALVVWGQPWILENWELSKGFITKWGWAVRECPELFASTNHWRAMRGEKQLSRVP